MADAPVVTMAEEDNDANLPPYVYPHDDPVMAAACSFMIDDISIDYPEADVSIPSALVIHQATGDDCVKLLADFWLYNYDLDGDILKTASGGEYPGAMTLMQNTGGTYTVTAFDVVEDGSDYSESVGQIFGDYADEFLGIGSSAHKRDETRLKAISDYVEANSLQITAYQDFGWDPVALSEKEGE